MRQLVTATPRRAQDRLGAHPRARAGARRAHRSRFGARLRSVGPSEDAARDGPQARVLPCDGQAHVRALHGWHQPRQPHRARTPHLCGRAWHLNVRLFCSQNTVQFMTAGTVYVTCNQADTRECNPTLRRGWSTSTRCASCATTGRRRTRTPSAGTSRGGGAVHVEFSLPIACESAWVHQPFSL
jgi:hypothetical protein